MGHVRNKTKTNRRAKRTKTNKRNARKQTFRKSRRVNRGGKGPEKRSRDDEGYDNVKRIREDTGNKVYNSPVTMEEKMIANKENNDNNRHHQEQDEHYSKQDVINLHNIEINTQNAKTNMSGKDPTIPIYREPLYRNRNDFYVNQSTQLENTERQRKFEDMMDIEDPDTPTFGGKKKRATRRK